ncbi:MAG: hypothetical protein COB53_09710 [Elusimicrobia bacterium]|nr:MAG: hypothetical protein COB53_09710 [Elusimicrobiota bacterium]
MKKKLKILVVDDEEQIRWMLKIGLEGSGWDVVHVGDGLAALKEVEASKFDLIILDIMMPGISGWDTLGRLRKLPHHKKTPVLMLSAKSTLGDVEQSLDLGANDYITKPFDLPTLHAKVDKLLGPSANP